MSTGKPMRWVYRAVLGIAWTGCAFYFGIAAASENKDLVVVAIMFALFGIAAIATKSVAHRVRHRTTDGVTQDPLSHARQRAWNMGSETIDDFGRVKVEEAAARLRVAAALTDAVARIAEERVATATIRASVAFRARGEFAAAIEAIDRGEQPEEIERDHSALLARGLAKLGSGNHEGALEDFRRADRRLAHIAGAVESNIAAAQIQAGDFQMALQAAERGISHMARSGQTTGHWLPHVYRVSALELSGDEGGATVALQAMAQSIANPEESAKAAAYLKRQALTAALRRRVDVDDIFGQRC